MDLDKAGVPNKTVDGIIKSEAHRIDGSPHLIK